MNQKTTETNMELKTGNQLRIIIQDISRMAKVIEVHEVETSREKVFLPVMEVEEYGVTAPFIVRSGEIVQGEVDFRRDSSWMPVEYRSKHLKDFDWSLYNENTELQEEIVEAYIENFKSFALGAWSLYIFSKTKGTGKTLLACCIANEIIEKYGKSVKFITMAEYIELIKDKTDEGNKKKESIYNARLLIIDDIGATTESRDWIQGAIFQLVNRRYSDKAATIFTSNVKIEELNCGERTMQRIYDDGIEIPMPEISIRMKKADERKKAFLKSILKNKKAS